MKALQSGKDECEFCVLFFFFFIILKILFSKEFLYFWSICVCVSVVLFLYPGSCSLIVTWPNEGKKKLSQDSREYNYIHDTVK